MTDNPTTGDLNSEPSERNSLQRLQDASLVKQRSRRNFLITSLVIPSLLVAVSAALLIDHFVISSSGSISLADERQLGLSDAASGGCPAAISLLTSVVAADSLDYTSKVALGNCYFTLGQYNLALSLLKNVALSQPDLSNEFNLAKVAFASGNNAMGQTALKSAITVANSPSDFLVVATTAEYYSAYAVAVAALGHVTSTWRTYLWYEYDATAQLFLGFSAKAVADAKQAVSLAPQSLQGVTLVNLGNTYNSAWNYTAAIIAYRSALLTHQQIDGLSVYSALSQCYIQLGQYSTAIATIQNGIANLPVVDQYSLELIEATALSDLHRTQQAILILRSIGVAKFAPPNVVAAASAQLATLNG